MREFYATWENWLFAAAVVVCLLFVIYSMKDLWQKKRPQKGKPLFPKMVLYYGRVYHRHDPMPDNFFPKYLTYYTIIVMIMGILEYIVEGDIGLLVRLEIWGIAGAFLGEIFFSFIGVILGALIGGIILLIDRTAPVALTIWAWGEGLSKIGAFIGLLIGMVVFYIVIALLNKLNFLVVVAAALIPAMIVLAELAREIYKIIKAAKFEDKVIMEERGIRAIVSAGDDSVENPLPEVVVSRDPDELSKKRITRYE